MTAVTPVLMSWPSMSVTWPTFTPSTSVILFSLPAASTPGAIPACLALGLMLLRSAACRPVPDMTNKTRHKYLLPLLPITLASCLLVKTKNNRWTLYHIRMLLGELLHLEDGSLDAICSQACGSSVCAHIALEFT